MSPQWFCVCTSPRKEMAVAAALKLLGLEVYLPVEASMRKCRGVRRRVDRALIPSHLFYAVERDRNVFSAVRGTDDVRRILSTERDGAAREVPALAIEIVKEVEEDLLTRFEKRWAKRRDRREDADEVIERLAGAPPQERAAVLYELIGRGKKARLRFGDMQQLMRSGLQPRRECVVLGLGIAEGRP